MRFRIAAFLRRRDLLRSSGVMAAMVLLFLAAPLSHARADDEMTFETVEYGGIKAISASGRITERTPQMFLDFLQSNSGSGLHTIVFLDSPGGIVLSSMQLGTVWRKIGAAVVVAQISRGFFGASGSLMNAQCLSACVYALIGGRKRVIPPESEVGIHKMFLTVDGTDVTALSSQKDRATAKSLRDLLSSYTSKMGVSPELIARAEKTPSQDLHILTPAEIKKWRLGVPDM
jgi:hypothetical protein